MVSTPFWFYVAWERGSYVRAILGVMTSSSGDSQLGTTRVVFGVHMHVQGRLVPNSLPMRKKAETRLSVDLTNEVQHVGIREVSLESAEEKIIVQSRFVLFIISKLKTFLNISRY